MPTLRLDRPPLWEEGGSDGPAEGRDLCILAIYAHPLGKVKLEHVQKVYLLHGNSVVIGEHKDLWGATDPDAFDGVLRPLFQRWYPGLADEITHEPNGQWHDTPQILMLSNLECLLTLTKSPSM